MEEGRKRGWSLFCTPGKKASLLASGRAEPFCPQSEGYEDADEPEAQRSGMLPPMKANGPMEIEPARVVTTSNNESRQRWFMSSRLSRLGNVCTCRSHDLTFIFSSCRELRVQRQESTIQVHLSIKASALIVSRKCQCPFQTASSDWPNGIYGINNLRYMD